MIFDKYIDVPEADTMPLDRWEAYMKSVAFSKGYHGRFSLDKPSGGVSRIKVFTKN